MTRKDRLVPLILSGFCFGACLTMGIQAHAQSAPYQIVRTGDSTMSCAALASEINTLAQPAADKVAQAKPKKHGGLGMLKMLGAAVPMVGGFGGIGGGVVSSLVSTAGSAAAQNQAQHSMDDAQDYARRAMAGPSPAEQRKQRLQDLFDQHGC